MAGAEQRIIQNIWVCMKCNAKQRVSPNKKPRMCKKCKSKQLRVKKKKKK